MLGHVDSSSRKTIEPSGLRISLTAERNGIAE
jgi:hypothetical protein